MALFHEARSALPDAPVKSDRALRQSVGRWDVLYGLVGFFVGAAVLTALGAEVRGRSALPEVGFLLVVTALFLLVRALRARAERRLHRPPRHA
jgi:uncharacterized membrane protein YfcA